MNTYVYFHIGEELWQPELLTRSILKCDPSAQIIQLSNSKTGKVRGVSVRINTEDREEGLMFSRLNSFRELKLDRPAIYLDTDMLVLEPIVAADCLGGKKIAMCKRIFQTDWIFNPAIRGLDFSEYKGMTLASVYPYLACATVTRSNQEWAAMVDILKSRDKKFYKWYGDQEALRIYYDRFPADVAHLPEDVYACLPEELDPNKLPAIIHFKGAGRKLLMERYSREILGL